MVEGCCTTVRTKLIRSAQSVCRDGMVKFRMVLWVEHETHFECSERLNDDQVLVISFAVLLGELRLESRCIFCHTEVRCVRYVIEALSRERLGL